MTAHRPARTCAVLTCLALTALPGASAAAGTGGPAPSLAASSASATPSDEPSGQAATTGTTSARPEVTTVTTSEGVEVTTYGTVQVRGYQDQDPGVVTIAVHGVQRVEGGTVVYASVAYPEGDNATSPAFNEIVSTQVGGRYAGGGGVTGFRLVETGAGRVLSVLREPGEGSLTGALATKNTALPAEPDQLVAVYAVMPELDPATETVDVQVGFGQVVPDVPVGDGLLEPALPSDAPVPLGAGWPEVDLDAVADAPEPELSVYPLSSVQQALDASTTTTETTEQVSIDVSADVLFAQDSADLGPEARATLEQVGADVVARASGGSLAVVGHTDSQASDAYNLDLSRRRAEAVATVLRPFAEQAGLSLAPDGRGEVEPVADNGSEEGRQANRRVTVTFDVAEETP